MGVCVCVCVVCARARVRACVCVCKREAGILRDVDIKTDYEERLIQIN